MANLVTVKCGCVGVDLSQIHYRGESLSCCGCFTLSLRSCSGIVKYIVDYLKVREALHPQFVRIQIRLDSL